MTAEHVLQDIHAIHVQPLGDVPRATMDTVVRLLSRRVGVPCRHVPGLPDDALPRLPHRPQLDADALLELLESRPAARGAVTLGIAAEDLGHPLFTFFFGRARMGGGALISLHRLSPEHYGLPPDRNVTLRRAVLECLHELGHVAGLHHCTDHACVMHFSGDVESIDLRGGGYCAPCAASLPLALRHALHG